MPENDFNMYGNDAPTNRKQCSGNERPCPWVRCKSHLVFDAFPNPKRTTDDEVVDKLCLMSETCILDVVENGEKTLEEVGQILGITRERVRQVEGSSNKRYIKKGISKLRDSPSRMRRLTEIREYDL